MSEMKLIKLIDDVDHENNKVISVFMNKNVASIDTIATSDATKFSRENDRDDSYSIEESVECTHDNLRQFAQSIITSLDALQPCQKTEVK